MRSTKLSVSRAFKKFASGMTSAVRNCLLAAPRAGLAYAPVKRRRSPEGPRQSNGRSVKSRAADIQQNTVA